MKKIVLTMVMAAFALSAFAQAKKPSIMVMPSEAWCFANGYFVIIDDQGVEKKVADYATALQSDMDLLQVISKLNDLMFDRGFPLQNLESVIKDLQQTETENLAMKSEEDGSEVKETIYEKVRRKAKADIIMQITWDIVKRGPQSSIRYNLQGLDSYSNKQVAGDSGVGEPSFSASVPVLLEEAIYSHMDNFCDRLQAHFDDMFVNGREVSYIIQVFDSSEYNLESEFDGYELCEIIDEWFAQNTVSGRYNITEQSTNIMILNPVRIPLYEENGTAVDASRFIRKMTRFLRSEPYNVSPIKVSNQGLGRCLVTLGNK